MAIRGLGGCLAFGITLSIALSSTSWAGPLQDAPQNKGSETPQKNEGKKEKKIGPITLPGTSNSKEKAAREQKKYQDIKRQARDRAAKDLGFVDEVNAHYESLLRDQSSYAYSINTRDTTDEKITRTGDRLKIEDTLYDNPLVQDYVNRVGQSVVPKASENLFAFRVTLNPIPEARSLATGTVYISTGLLALVDNEAQLAYLLGHEVGHIEKGHWYEDVMIERELDIQNERKQNIRQLMGIGGSVLLGGLGGGLTGSFGNGALTAIFAQMSLPTLLKVFMPNATATWDRIQEDEADSLGLKYMLERSYDPREVPRFYQSLEAYAKRDRRVKLGFWADAVRITERVVAVNQFVGGMGAGPMTNLVYGSSNLATELQMREARKQLDATMKQVGSPSGSVGSKGIEVSRDAQGRAEAAERTLGETEIQEKLRNGILLANTGEFKQLMAELRRDNGIRAFYYDMFQVARTNLAESLAIRSNDPFAHFYYGKVLKLTAKTEAEKQTALNELTLAIDLDKRQVIAEPYLYRALARINAKDPRFQDDLIRDLKDYVRIYQRQHAGELPPDIGSVYDYLQDIGDLTWAAHPATRVSTKDIDPLGTTSSNPTPNTSPEVKPSGPRGTVPKGKP